MAFCTCLPVLTISAALLTVSEDTGVNLTNLNGGSALNYLLLVRLSHVASLCQC